jgi:valyl-tRNA synthetase
MQPQMADKIDKLTRKDFPEGIPAFGTDALRFTYAALASTGRDINFDLGRIEGYRNFCNKLWNAARYVLLNTENEDCGQDGGEIELNAADRWITSMFQKTVQEVVESINSYRFDLAAQAIYSFTWDEYCDWYLELSKSVLMDMKCSAAARRGTRKTLVSVMESLLRLAHPVIPFITEEIWQRMAPLAGSVGSTIMLQPYPEADITHIDQAAIEEIEWVKNFIIGVRKIRSGMNIDPRKPLPVLLQNGMNVDQLRLAKYRHYLVNVGRVESVEWLKADTVAPESATALVGNMRLLIPLSGLIDKEAEIIRLGKELDKKVSELERCEKKLNNDSFVDKAPAAVVKKERLRANELKSAISNLQEQRQRIQSL